MPVPIGGALLCLAAACRPASRPVAPSPGPDPGRVTLVFSASVAGQLVPCGCSPDQRGGLPRAVSLVNKLRQAAPDLIFIAAGALLFETPQRHPEQLLTQRRRKARALARGDELLGAVARAVGQRDLALGAQFAAETAGQVPLLDAGVAPVPGARATALVKGVGIFAAGFEQGPGAPLAARAKEFAPPRARPPSLPGHPPR